jgi:bacteriocin-like protein
MEILIELTEDELTQIAGGAGSASFKWSNTAISPTSSAVTTTVRNFASHSSSFNFGTLTATAV